MVLDIDNTLGSDLGVKQSLIQKGLSSSEAKEKALAEWKAIRHLTSIQFVEKDCPEIIKTLQKPKNQTISLTTQGLELSTRITSQLEKLWIDLTVSSPKKEDLFNPKLAEIEIDSFQKILSDQEAQIFLENKKEKHE